jgi:SNF2 family DNA or RNA helicase
MFTEAIRWKWAKENPARGIRRYPEVNEHTARCLVVCPGSLPEQWQDELYKRFHLRFDILTNDKLEAASSGNWFLETNLAIARLDKLSRNEDVQKKLQFG